MEIDILSGRIKRIENDDGSKTVLWVGGTEADTALEILLRNMEDIFDHGEVIYHDRNKLVRFRAGEVSGLTRDIVVKKFILSRRYDRFRFHFLDSKALRSLRMALVLRQVGINTPEPLGWVETRTPTNGIVYSYYVSEYVPHECSLLDIFENRNHPLWSSLNDFLPEIARLVRKMHDAGIIHNDLHGGYILLAGEPTQREYYFIDLNRARMKTKVTTRMRIKDLARLALDPDQMELFLRSYTPENYRSLLTMMIEERQKRVNFMRRKRKIKALLRKSG